MFKDIVTLIKQSIAYGAGNILIAGTGILLIPLYTRYLTVSDYGIIGSLAPLSAVLMYFYNLGISGAVMRFDSGIADDEERKKAHGTAWVFLMVVAVFTTLLLALVGSLSWTYAFPAIPYFPFALLVLGTVALDATNVVPMALLRIRGKAVAFSTIQFVRFVAMTSLIILFVVSFRLGVKGQMTAVLISSLLFSVVYIAITRRYITVCLRLDYLKKYLAFGLPTVLSGLSGWVLSLSNALILQRMTTLEQVGLFALGCKFGQAMDILAIAVITAWEPFFYNKAETDRGPELFAQVGTYYFLAVVGMGCVVLLGAQPLLHIATTPKFFDAGRVVGFVVVGSILRAMYMFNVQGISYRMKTKYLPFIDGSAAVVNVACSLALIHKFGMLGAACSTMIAYAFQCGCTFVVSRRLYPIPYQYGRLIRILVVYAAALWALFQVSFDFGLWTLLVRLALFPLLVLGGLVLLRVPEERETRKVSDFLLRLKMGRVGSAA